MRALFVFENEYVSRHCCSCHDDNENLLLNINRRPQSARFRPPPPPPETTRHAPPLFPSLVPSHNNNNVQASAAAPLSCPPQWLAFSGSKSTSSPSQGQTGPAAPAQVMAKCRAFRSFELLMCGCRLHLRKAPVDTYPPRPPPLSYCPQLLPLPLSEQLASSDLLCLLQVASAIANFETTRDLSQVGAERAASRGV